MYKIYINDTPLYLASVREAMTYGEAGLQNLVLRYPGKKKFLLNIFQQLEADSRYKSVLIFSENPDDLWKDFTSLFKLMDAAGGVVFNQKGEILLIFRRQHWDLPKGKLDKGETFEQAALREVNEETGLGNLKPGSHLLDTWHTYRLDDRKILKKTAWFAMTTDDNLLRLQKEEDIEKALWLPLEQASNHPPVPIYPSILDVLKDASEKRDKHI